MLDLNNPQSEIIFKASGYIDQIKMMCQKYPIQDFEERQLTFSGMQENCEKFTAFCRINFPKQFDELNSLIEGIKSEGVRLAALDMETGPGKCKACNGNLTSYKFNVKEFGILYFCDTCPQKIYEFTNLLEQHTGAWMI